MIQFDGLARQRDAVTSEVAIAALLDCDGNLDLCAERTGFRKSEIVEAIADDMPEFKRKMAAVQTIQLAAIGARMRLSFQQALNNLDAPDIARTYLKVQEMINGLVVDKTSQINVDINTYTWQHLPPGLKELLVQIEQSSELARQVESLAQLPVAGEVHGGD